jgi:hypothetical protein
VRCTEKRKILREGELSFPLFSHLWVAVVVALSRFLLFLPVWKVRSEGEKEEHKEEGKGAPKKN